MSGGASGSLVAAAIWNEFMRKALEGKPIEEFTRPEGVVDVAVDALSGKLPTAFTPSTKVEVFASNFNVPSEFDNVHLNGYTILHSEKPQDPAWEEPVRAWAAANGYTYPPDDTTSSNDGKIDTSLEINANLPQKITSLPWKVEVEAKTADIPEIQIFVDNSLLTSALSKTLSYESKTAHVDGTHQLLIQVRTRDGKVNRKSAQLEFALEKNLILTHPGDNETLQFPTNIVVESNQNVSEDEVKFVRRSAAGKEAAISGAVTRQQLGQIYYYTLNWSTADKPTPSSYQIYAQIGADKSNAVTVKIP